MTQVQSFKVGDKVTLRKDLTRELAETLDEFRAGWVPAMVDAIGKEGTILKGNEEGNYRISFPDVPTYWYSPYWLQPPTPGIYVAVSKLRKIYDVACSQWKRKISKLVPDAFAENIFISEEQIREMEEAANREQLPVIKEVFQEYYKTQDECQYQHFSESFEVGHGSGTNGNPFIIHVGLATAPGMQRREIGFLKDRNIPILCNKETGEEVALIPGVHYLKFKLAK